MTVKIKAIQLKSGYVIEGEHIPYMTTDKSFYTMLEKDGIIKVVTNPNAVLSIFIGTKWVTK